jgi:hypothetical protein
MLLVKMYGVHLLARSETLKKVSNLLLNPQSMEGNLGRGDEELKIVFFFKLGLANRNLEMDGALHQFLNVMLLDCWTSVIGVGQV